MSMTNNTATITVHNTHEVYLKDLLSLNNVQHEPAKQDESTPGTITYSLPNFQPGELRINVLLDELVENNVSFSFLWCNNAYGGETHYRYIQEQGEQYRSWLDAEKNTVNIEQVRDALNQGHIAVLDLLEETEANYTPWPWNDVTQTTVDLLAV